LLEPDLVGLGAGILLQVVTLWWARDSANEQRVGWAWRHAPA
jgi:hypothetical protein